MEEDDWHVSGLTVGQVAKRMHIARRFFADVLCRVAMIRASQRVGLSIEQIREALSALPPRQAPAPEDWERLAAHLRRLVSQRIDELFAILDELGSAPANGVAIPHAGRAGHPGRD